MNDRDFDRMIRERIAKEAFVVERRTEEKLSRSLKKKRPLRAKTVFLAAAALILTSAAALASLEGLGIVDFIGRESENVQTPNDRAGESGASLRVAEAVFSGDHLYAVVELQGENLTEDRYYASIAPENSGVLVVNETVDSRLLGGILYEFHSLTLSGAGEEERFSVSADGMEITVTLSHMSGAKKVYLPADGRDGESGIAIRWLRLTSSEDAATLVVEYLDPAYEIPGSDDGPFVWCDGENYVHLDGACPILAERGEMSQGALGDYWATQDGVQFSPDEIYHLCRECLPASDGEMGAVSSEPDYAIEVLDGAGNPYEMSDSSTVFLREEEGAAILEATLSLDPAAFGEEIQIRVYDIGTKQRFGTVTLYAMEE